MIAWANDHSWFITEHVIGPTLAEVLQTDPTILSPSARQAILGRVLGQTTRYLDDGWDVPTTAQIRLGFDGTVVVEVEVRPPPSPGTAQATFELRGDALVGACGLSPRWRPALASWATMALPEEPFVETFPGMSLWFDARWRMQREPWEGSMPPGPWTEAQGVAAAIATEEVLGWAVSRRTEFSFSGEADRLLNTLADRDQEFVDVSPPHVDMVRDAPHAIARLQLMREKPLSRWTWLEFKAWSGVRRQRLRELHRRRGLPPEDAAVAEAEDACEALVLSCTVTPEVSPPLLGVPGPRLHRLALHDPRIDDQPPPDALAAIEAERGELIARGLFALEAWCAAAFDGASSQDVRTAWRQRWLEVDAALGEDGLARVALSPPQFPTPDAERLEHMAELMEGEALAVAPVVEVEVDAVGPSPSPRVVLGHRWRQTFRKAEVVLGHSQSCDLSLTGLSRRHVALWVRDGGLTIVDLDTTNGVVIDGQAIREPVRLEPGQLAIIGPYHLRARLLPPDAPWLDVEPT